MHIYKASYKQEPISISFPFHKYKCTPVALLGGDRRSGGLFHQASSSPSHVTFRFPRYAAAHTIFICVKHANIMQPVEKELKKVVG